MRYFDRGERPAQASRIGDILIAQGKLTEEQLARALEVQRRTRKRLGSILVSMGYISPADLARGIARRLNLEYVELSEDQVDLAMAGMIGEKLLRRYGALPLGMKDGRLRLAMSDPTNVHALDDVKMISGHPVVPVVASEEDVRRVQNRLFAVGGEVSEFLREAQERSAPDEEPELASEAEVGDAPIIRLVNSILQQAASDGASDIHIEPWASEISVRFRVDGVLREIMSIPRKLHGEIVARVKIMAGMNIAERRVPQDGRFSLRLGDSGADLRVASLPTVYGEKLVLRILDGGGARMELEKLGFESRMLELYRKAFGRPHGAILVTGPTGSGKSTTLYATLNELNSPERSIVTVEDPVEHRITGVNQIQVNPRVGLTFASGLRSILRSDPEVIMIGEIRDYETAKISVESALTGHLVLATLHTNDAPGALNRLTDMGVEPFLTASAVDCVLAQRLARRVCDRCSRPAEPDRRTLEEVGFPFELSGVGEPDFREAVGCRHCGGSGYRGRVGVYELMLVSEEIREMVVRRTPTSEIAQAARSQGMMRLREDGLLKAARGVTTIEEVLRSTV
ncbi:type II secretion system protein GspE [Rubrobacter taiwanensis]|uniref:Type II secretion system protein GspE n=1 Tax=Rubrobacter taiwanensis TaxID=185139 RepID=A0A4R1BHC6_9ACTN|nr:ATPase, T2SS/T4P/T4SS family [Rubrobacter taiwanensis]TCJ16685.1 type II secretion system protein GspE [Rubrobacter taiwanensis]